MGVQLGASSVSPLYKAGDAVVYSQGDRRPASLGTFSAETGEVVGKPGHMVMLRNPKGSKGMCLLTFGGDQVLCGREDRFANQFFSEVSSFHHLGDKIPQIS